MFDRVLNLRDAWQKLTLTKTFIYGGRKIFRKLLYFKSVVLLADTMKQKIYHIW